MRKLPTILAGLFLIITLTRVAALAADGMGAGLLGWAFAAGLGAAVYVSAYYTRVSGLDRNGDEDRRSKSVRRAAMVSLVLFAAVDGLFNLAEVLRSLTDPTLIAAAWVYGLFPTLAAGLLGWLQGHVDRLPRPPQRYALGVALRAWAVSLIPQASVDTPAEISLPAKPAALQPAAPAESPLRAAYVCETCGYSSDNQRSYAGHMRHHAKVSVDA